MNLNCKKKPSTKSVGFANLFLVVYVNQYWIIIGKLYILWEQKDKKNVYSSIIYIVFRMQIVSNKRKVSQKRHNAITPRCPISSF